MALDVEKNIDDPACENNVKLSTLKSAFNFLMDKSSSGVSLTSSSIGYWKPVYIHYKVYIKKTIFSREKYSPHKRNEEKEKQVRTIYLPI